MDRIWGILLCCLLGAFAVVLERFVPLGAVTLALILGMLFANIIKIPARAEKGVLFTEKKILAGAIALLGFSLDYSVLLSLGCFPLLLIASGVPFTILTALFWGRVMGVERDLALLVGTGNGICGSSAIAAAQGVIEAKEDHVGVSVAVINLLGMGGILLLPLIVSLFPQLSEQAKGMAVGNTLQAVGQVTAAGFSLGDLAGQTAVLIKMGRVLLISPVVLIYGFIKGRNRSEEVPGDSRKSPLPGIPPFILLFILFSLVNTTGLIPPPLTQYIKEGAHLLLITAMAGIGMKISFKGLAREGRQALVLGVLTWTVQTGFTLLLILLFT
ncbi:MAG: putative sulfate exporter family transporter [Spirochaetales bacterium]|nr:putative sulfate exporter family transporter [Spirochaetales bacterium]